MKRTCFLLISLLLVNSACADIFSDVSWGWYRSVKKQLDAGVAVDLADCFANTLLHKAAEAGQLRVARLLVEYGAPVNCFNIFGESPLSLAVKASWYDMAQWLLEQGAIQDGLSLTENLSPILHQVVARGDEKFVRLLVQYKADLNAKDQDGQTPLLLAINGGNCSLAEFLIRAGADVNEKDSRGLSPLILAFGCEQQSLLELLLEYGAEIDYVLNNCFNALFVAAYCNRVDIVKVLLAYGADVNLSFFGKQITILHVVSFVDRESVVLDLLEAGALVDSVCAGGITPLMIAAKRRNLGITKLLLERGANMFIADETGKTPYDYALESKNKQIINLFEEYKEKQQAQVAA